MKNRFLFILGLWMAVFNLWSNYVNAQTQGKTLKVGTVYWAVDDSTGLKSIYEVWDNQCPPPPANIYIHDTLWAIPGGYSQVKPAVPPIPPYREVDSAAIMAMRVCPVCPPPVVCPTCPVCPTPPPAPPGLTSIFTTQSLPTSVINDGTALEMGVKFTSSAAGYIYGIRFYKLAGNSGTHVGELYTITGGRLASYTFVNETASGWQTVLFPTPVPIQANTVYVGCYFSPTGAYSITANAFATAIVNPPLTALADGTNGANGVYKYTNSPFFPGSTFQKSNYWVDVIYSPK